MKTTLSIILLYLFFPISVFSDNIYCTGHDACKNKVWSGEYNIYCGASNSERTCRNTVLNCGEGDDCLIKTQGSGHDAYQSSTVNAKESNSFKLTCQASGQRDCKTITVWCPQGTGTTCECISCPSTVTFKCVQGVSCSSVSNAHIDYVAPDKYQIPDTIWDKDTTHTGKRPDCLSIQIPGAITNKNYKWGTLGKCKETCIEEPTGKCNMLSRYGDLTKSDNEPWHCRFYACPDPTNFNWIIQSEWGNYASECNTYKMPIRHFTIESRYQNITRYINETIYNNITTEILKYINTSKYYYDDEIIKNICIEGQYTYYNGNTNEAWTRKSWLLGCNQYILGYKTVGQCKSQCNCNKAPNTFSSHSKYRQCSKDQASSNYMPCRQNACSGGNCCARSTTICKSACKAYNAINIGGEMITYKNVNIQVYKDIYRNKTKYINRTRFINVTDYIIKYHDVYKNKTRYINVTDYITRYRDVYKNKTRYINVTNDIIRYNDVIRNLTRFINITNEIVNYVNRTRYVDIPIYINKTRYNNITREIIHFINKYNYINITNVENTTKVLTKIIWREKYNITNVKNISNIIKINWINKTRWINKTKYKQVVVKVPVTDNDNDNYPPGSYNSYDRNTPPNKYKNETCNCKEEHPMSFWVQIGFFITLGFSVFAALVCIWRCWLKDMIEEFIDDLFCCGYGDQIKMCCGICCILCELCKDDSSEEEVEMTTRNPRLRENIPTAEPVNKNLIIDTNANPIYRIEEGVTTPGGTQIRRRTVQV